MRPLGYTSKLLAGGGSSPRRSTLWECRYGKCPRRYALRRPHCGCHVEMTKAGDGTERR